MNDFFSIVFFLVFLSMEMDFRSKIAAVHWLVTSNATQSEHISTDTKTAKTSTVSSKMETIQFKRSFEFCVQIKWWLRYFLGIRTGRSSNSNASIGNFRAQTAIENRTNWLCAVTAAIIIDHRQTERQFSSFAWVFFLLFLSLSLSHSFFWKIFLFCTFSSEFFILIKINLFFSSCIKQFTWNKRNSNTPSVKCGFIHCPAAPYSNEFTKVSKCQNVLSN